LGVGRGFFRTSLTVLVENTGSAFASWDRRRAWLIFADPSWLVLRSAGSDASNELVKKKVPHLGQLNVAPSRPFGFATDEVNVEVQTGHLVIGGVLESHNGPHQRPHADLSARGREGLERAGGLLARGRALYASRRAACVC
jgi:hypothetical protein